MPAVEPERRAALNAAKLRALVAARFGEVEAIDGGGFTRGSAMSDGARAWVLADERPERALGPALAWAAQRRAGELHLLIDDADAAGQVARRGALFATPVTVWLVSGRELVEAKPTAPPDVDGPSAAAVELAAMITEAGADVAIEHGVVTGEVLGLEVARVIDDPDRGARLEVGVGRHDREAFAIVHGDVPTPDALAAVIDAVRKHRHPGADSHPLNQLVSERWLLVDVLAGGLLAELDGWRLQRVAGTVPRQSVKEVLPAFAAGHDRQGHPVVVAVSTGIDLDVVPLAADVREVLDPFARLMIVVPERDAHPVTRRLAADLRVPATVLTVVDSWRQRVPPA